PAAPGRASSLAFSNVRPLAAEQRPARDSTAPATRRWRMGSPWGREIERDATGAMGAKRSRGEADRRLLRERWMRETSPRLGAIMSSMSKAAPSALRHDGAVSSRVRQGATSRTTRPPFLGALLVLAGCGGGGGSNLGDR